MKISISVIFTISAIAFWNKPATVWLKLHIYVQIGVRIWNLIIIDIFMIINYWYFDNYRLSNPLSTENQIIIMICPSICSHRFPLNSTVTTLKSTIFRPLQKYFIERSTSKRSKHLTKMKILIEQALSVFRRFWLLFRLCLPRCLWKTCKNGQNI